MVRVLALDASTTAVGWALGCDGELRSSGVFLPGRLAGNPKDWVERVSRFRHWLDRKRDALHADVFIYETPSSNRNQMVTRQLGAVEWNILDAARVIAIPFFGINQNTIKATGISKIGKPTAELYKGYPLDEKHAGDEADALGALYWYFNVREADNDL